MESLRTQGFFWEGVTRRLDKHCYKGWSKVCGDKNDHQLFHLPEISEQCHERLSEKK
jgi:hypothetical protein